MPQTMSSSFETKVIIGLISVIIALGTTLVAVGFWAGSVKNELKNTKEALVKKVDLNVYESNNNRIDSMMLSLNNTDRNLSEQIKQLTRDNKEDHRIMMEKIDTIVTNTSGGK